MSAAARSLDPTACTKHAPGTGLNPTLQDTGQVHVNGLPVARAGERAYCASGSTDAVLTGAAMVLVGGRPMARCGETMVHGGVVAKGSPNVFVGGDSAGPGGMSVERDGNKLRLGGFITIDGSDAFAAETLHDLAIMAATPSGRKLIDKMKATGRAVTIRETTDDNGYAFPTDLDASVAQGHPVYDGHGQPREHWWGGKGRRGTGEGSDAIVEYNPNWNIGHHSGAEETPRDTVLFHELSHAQIYNQGEARLDPSPGWSTREEHRVIEGADPSEADYLRDRGYSHRRVSHCSQDDRCWVEQP